MGFKSPVPSFVAKEVVVPFAFSPFLEFYFSSEWILRAWEKAYQEHLVKAHHTAAPLERALTQTHVHSKQGQDTKRSPTQDLDHSKLRKTSDI